MKLLKFVLGTRAIIIYFISFFYCIRYYNLDPCAIKLACTLLTTPSAATFAGDDYPMRNVDSYQNDQSSLSRNLLHFIPDANDKVNTTVLFIAKFCTRGSHSYRYAT